MEIHQNYEAGTVTLRFPDVLDWATDYLPAPRKAISVVLGDRDYASFAALVSRCPDRSARADALERELVRTKADLLTARRDLTEYHRELRAEREQWESERAGYEGTLRALDDVDACNRNEIRELKDLVVAQAKRLVELEGETA
ncbi:hypothetical protein HEK616_40810 [Streptomyces nigrescens]|uniref:Uncharacterized protein n=1 Tax=Streptomyces nigrescens TaxID=1920 RepID=A0ABM7ZW48_STRNI|nr:hypothetical protein [Streptomyces nigrescens]BDM70594.1 hypothetical protein HEK616_40810 [Streptomyces nigrescens]